VADDPKTNPESTSKNPSINPETGKVNPSAPTAGTEGWGNTRDERQTLRENPPSMSREGQTSRARDEARDKQNTGDNQAELSGRKVPTETSMNVTHEGHDRTYRCADVGNADCRWETSGTTDEEIMQQAREHAQSAHGWKDWTDALHNRLRDAIRERRAA